MNLSLIQNSPLFNTTSLVIGNAVSVTIDTAIDYSKASEKVFIDKMLAEDPTHLPTATKIILHALVKEVTSRNIIIAYVDIPINIGSATPVSIQLQSLSIESFVAGIYDLEVLDYVATI